jgi:hypothetical protein
MSQHAQDMVVYTCISHLAVSPFLHVVLFLQYFVMASSQILPQSMLV